MAGKVKLLGSGSILKTSLIVIPVVLVLIAVSLLMPARQVSIEGIGTLSFETAITLSVGSGAAYASPGWLPGWSHRRQIDLSPNTPAANYQVLVILTTGIMGNPYANVKADGSDIRFTASDETTLQDYWVESWDSSGTSRIWVEVTLAGTDTLYMYYGNAAAGSLSNGDETFVFFDDFSTNTLADYDTAKWVDIHGDDYIAPTYDAANQRVAFDTGDNYASDMYPIGLNMDDFSMEVDFWADTSYPTDATIALVSRLQNPGTSSTHYYLDFSHGNYDSPGITVDSWGNGERSNTVYSEPSDYYWSFNQVHTFRYALFGSNQKFWWNKENTQVPDISVSDATYTSAGRLGLAAAQARGWWDNFRVRQYLEPEPMTSVGGEITVDISNSPGTYDFQTVQAGVNENTGTGHFYVTNNSTANITVTIICNGWTDTTDGTSPWMYGAPAANTAQLKASDGDGNYDVTVDDTTPATLHATSTPGDDFSWELQLDTPTSFTHGHSQQTTVTLTATFA